jgi:hypothetical protein
MASDSERDRPADSDLNQLVESHSPGLLADFWLFLRTNKKWWLLPLLIALLLLGLLVILSGTGLTPFIYPFA